MRTSSRTTSREEIVRVLRRAGYQPEVVMEIQALLPDPVDLHRDYELLRRYGITIELLMTRMGGSP